MEIIKEKEHHYKTKVVWTGNLGKGTENYNAYSRNHIVVIENKVNVECSSDPSFLGDKTKHNPEELLVSAISSCHMLWFLHLCSENRILVKEYSDEAIGKMIENQAIGGKFVEVILYPKVIISKNSNVEKANALHSEANRLCFIANSCNFPIKHIPTCISAEE